MSRSVRIVYGTMEFGRRMNADESQKVVDLFLSKGYSELDTARMYADGKSEKIIGEFPDSIKSKASIATKANPSSGLNAAGIAAQMSESLDCLQSKSVDIFYLHMPDHNTPIEETLQACQQLYTEGKFKELALSNYSAWQVAEIYCICQRNGWVLPTLYQGMYNAITRSVEKELFPALRHFGMRFYAYNPLAGGLLTGKHKFESANEPEKQPVSRFFGAGGIWAEKYRDRFWKEQNFHGIELVSKALKDTYGVNDNGELRVSLIDASLRWLKYHSMLLGEQNDGIILGTSNYEQMVENLAACEGGPLEPAIVSAFDTAWDMAKAHCPDYFR
ncbi:aflatoxin B1 aldehyde reductase member 2-like [Oscarella lobularis]|uniref:aflatoxin B1 aldehyde reductase member 2-like n=1 Tax=Oscarella lobularis TaxID=121494 RepID=UPI0033136F97